MTDLSTDTLSELRDLQRDAQQAQERVQMYVRALMRAHGHDPEVATVDVQEGVIREE